MTFPIHDTPANTELSIDELDAIAGGGFWSTVEHIAGDVGRVASKVGVGIAIGLGIFGGISLALGGAATQPRNTKLN